jgi:CheY-like chemotaxis protein
MNRANIESVFRKISSSNGLNRDEPQLDWVDTALIDYCDPNHTMFINSIKTFRGQGKDSMRALLYLTSGDSPSKGGPPKGPSTSSKTSNGHKHTPTILVVEDEILIRLPVSEFLRDSGYRVIEASNAAEAQSVLQAGEPVEIVFSDIKMPGMDGIMLAKWVRQQYPDIPVILTSGVTTADYRDAFFLPKPYEYEALAAYLKKLLGAG